MATISLASSVRSAVVLTTEETVMTNDPTLSYLLNGKRPRYRHEPRRAARTWTEIDDPEALDGEFQRLLWHLGEHMPTLEAARLVEFDWIDAGVGYDDLVAWINQGATVHDKALLWRLAAARVSPAVTARWWTSTATETVTVMRALLNKTTTVPDVRGLLDAGHLAS